MVAAITFNRQVENLLEMVVPALSFLSVLLTGAAMIAVYSAERRAVRKRLKSLEGPRGAAQQRQGSPVMEMVGRMGGGAGRRASKGLRQRLANAGFHSKSAPAIFLGVKQLLLLAGLLGASALLYATKLPVHQRVLVSVAAGAAMFFVPNVVVMVRRRGRTREIRHHLPDAVDLLEICVASGMGLDMAWNSVADEVRKVSNTLGDEMALTNLEIHLGAARGEALRHMAQRTGVQELGSMVSLLVQSDRFGTSIGETLRTFASSMRDERGMKAQETAEKMAVKLLLPMVLFIFPAVLVVLVGPAALRLFSTIMKN